jgi:hypothetical protein
VSLDRLRRWAKTRRTPGWDPGSSAPWGPLRFNSELRTAAEMMVISELPTQSEPGVPSSETGTAA